MIALLSGVFLASLLGSAHCAGMCGGIVAFLAGSGAGPADAAGARGRAEISPLRVGAAYHLGRLLSYAALGAAAGLAGNALDLGGEALGIGRAAILVAGGLMVAYGVLTLLRLRGVRLPLPRPRFAEALWRRAFARFAGTAPVARAAAIGLLTALLPCGWLYLFAVTAAGTGSAPVGALVMAAFWAGTVPALVVVGLGARRLAGPLSRRAPVFSAALLVAVGLWAVFGRFDVPSFAEARAQAQAAGVADEDMVPPCCAPAEE